jgi:hypothetical protein
MAVSGLFLMPDSAALGSLAKSTGMMPDRKSSSKYSVLRSHSARSMAGMLSLNKIKTTFNKTIVVFFNRMPRSLKMFYVVFGRF